MKSVWAGQTILGLCRCRLVARAFAEATLRWLSAGFAQPGREGIQRPTFYFARPWDACSAEIKTQERRLNNNVAWIKSVRHANRTVVGTIAVYLSAICYLVSILDLSNLPAIRCERRIWNPIRRKRNVDDHTKGIKCCWSNSPWR